MPVEDGGVSLRIVRFLQPYQSAVSIDLLARELGSRPETLVEDLQLLEKKGVLKIDPVEETVVLTDKKSSLLSTFFNWASGTP